MLISDKFLGWHNFFHLSISDARNTKQIKFIRNNPKANGVSLLKQKYKQYNMRSIYVMALGMFLGHFSYAHNPDKIYSNNKKVVSDTTQQAPENWFNLDPQENKVPGVSTEKAYEYLKNRPSKTVVVAVIDSGIDIAHEDLKDKIWRNENEIPGNGKDDDKNGYVDDVHGWNFIGGKDGRNVEHDTQELTRLYVAIAR